MPDAATPVALVYIATMKIVIAPDSFKESLGANAVAQALGFGLRKVLPEADIVMVPMADGGEGTLAALCGDDGELVAVHGPLGAMVAARLGVLADGCTAVIEVAQAIGLDKLAPEDRNPLLTTSFGVGELIRAGLDRGLRRFVVGLGGSATVDGGVGMLQALGVRFLDKQGTPLPARCGGGSLSDIASVDFSFFDQRLHAAHFTLACDVDNPLCGERGAAAVFGPQKGAHPADVAALDRGLAHLFELMESVMGRQVAQHPGAGAAGGLGAAMLLCLRASMRPGVDVIIEATGLADLLVGADLVVTGEGRVDEQTLFGKAPAGVARLARSCGVPVIAVGGSLESVESLWKSGLFDAVEAAVCRPCSVADALCDARSNLIDAGIRLGMWLSLPRLIHKSH